MRSLTYSLVINRLYHYYFKLKFDLLTILMFKVRRFKVNVFQDSIQNSPKPASADVILLIEFYSDLRHFFNGWVSFEHHVDLFGLEKLNSLQKQVVVSILQDADEIIFSQGFHFRLNRHSSLQFNCQLSRLDFLEGTCTHEQNVSSVYFKFYLSINWVKILTLIYWYSSSI